MQYIASALDPWFVEQVEDLWGEVAAVTGQKQLAGARRPHIVLHVAKMYGDDWDDTLARIASDIPPFAAGIGRVGVFRAETAVIALEVLRSPQLDRLHERIWFEMGPGSDAPKDVYRPETWAPHVTIATGALDDGQLELARAVLARHTLPPSVDITNICLIPREGAPSWPRFDFSAANT